MDDNIKLQTEAVRTLMLLVNKGIKANIYTPQELFLFNGIIPLFMEKKLPTIKEEEEEPEEEKKD